MENKSRVQLYAERRKKISEMEDYSFAETSSEGTSQEAKKDTQDLSADLDNLLEDKSSKEALTRKKEAHKAFRKKEKENKKKGFRGFPRWAFILILALLALLILLGVILLAIYTG